RDAFFGIILQHRLRFLFVNVESFLNDFLVRVIKAIVFQCALFQSLKECFAIGAGEVKNFFNIDHVSHDLRLLYVPRNPFEHENVDIRFKLVRVHRRGDRFLPKFDRDVVRDELAFARIFEERFPERCAGVDRPEDVAAGAMKEARNAAERFALSAFPAPWRAEQNERAVFHEMSGYTALAANREGNLFHRYRIDIHASTAAIEADVAVHECENGVITAEPDVFAGEKFSAPLTNDDIAGDDHLTAESLYAEPLADAVAAIL